MTQKELGKRKDEIVLSISPTTDRRELSQFMDLVEQAMKDNEDASGATLFRLNSKDRLGRKIEASIAGGVSATFPHVIVTFDTDLGWGLGHSAQKLFLFKDHTKVIDGSNQLYVGREYQLTEFFSVACRALEGGVLPSEIRIAANVVYGDILYKIPEDNHERLQLLEDSRVKFSGELSRRQFL